MHNLVRKAAAQCVAFRTELLHGRQALFFLIGTSWQWWPKKDFLEALEDIGHAAGTAQ